MLERLFPLGASLLLRRKETLFSCLPRWESRPLGSRGFSLPWARVERFLFFRSCLKELVSRMTAFGGFTHGRCLSCG